jgi:anti-sigma factor RsiW
MSDHLSQELLCLLADGEMPTDQLGRAQAHLAECPSCTSSALTQSLLKSATARAGWRYAPPQDLQMRLASLARQDVGSISSSSSIREPKQVTGIAGWAVAFALVIIFGSVLVVGRNSQRYALANSEFAGLVTEAADQHVATLAANLAPQVLSSDRHTVKPWFQGKLPFSFNLPENLPDDTKLEGANLTYLHGRPAALLLYSMGKHRVSVFVQEKPDANVTAGFSAEHAGFHVLRFNTDELEMIVVSDADPVRLSKFAMIFNQSQTGAPGSIR